MGSLTLRSLSGLPELRAGDDLAAEILAALQREHPRAGRVESTQGAAGQPSNHATRTPRAEGATSITGDQIVVIAQKAVSKVEGAVVALSTLTPSARAIALAEQADGGRSGTRKDPRVVQIILDQSAEILRAEHGVLICRTRHGFVCANAGVDLSNVADGWAALLPLDPDRSARRIRARLRVLTGAAPGVIVTDSFGRAWRHGQCDIALGCAGVAPLDDWRGRTDAHGRPLSATWLAAADAIAAAADLARGKDSGEPVAIVEGLGRLITAEDGPGAAALIRPLEEDLFR